MAGLKNVLVVEDDDMIRELYRTTLVNHQFSVAVAGTAEEAFRVVQTFRPDCILLDIMLPGFSGLDVLKELRTKPEYHCKDAAIILLTNISQRTLTETAVESGADGYIIKSDILPSDLPNIIASLE